jgi:hypothetical protein
MPKQPDSEAEKFCRENITITGLEIVRSEVNGPYEKEITLCVGQNEDPFTITIPHNVLSIESKYDYWPVLCLRSSAGIGKVAARAKLERNPPTEPSNFTPCELTDLNGAIQIPFPGSPTAPNNFYHRWWRWPRGPAWREPARYILKIWLGYNKYKPTPDPLTERSAADWISKPITWNIRIVREEPPKKEK